MPASATRQLYPLGLTTSRPVAGSPTPPDAAAPDWAAALTRRLAAGDEDAFREFHEKFFDRLHQFLLAVARGNEHEAREALQETLLRVARRVRAFDNEESFWCWLRAVARNAARDAGRKRTRYVSLLQNFALGESAAAPARPPLEENLLRAALDEAVNEMDAGDRRLILGKYLEGETVRELAAHTGFSEKTVESRLLRLRRYLRERILRKLQTP